MKRPVVYWGILFILGEILYKVLPVSLMVLGAGGIAIIIARIPNALFQKYKKILWIGILFYLLGLVCSGYAGKQQKACQFSQGTLVTVEGTVTEIEESGKTTYYVLQTQRMNDTTVHIKIRITLLEEEMIQPGCRIKGLGTVKEFSTATNPGGYDEKSYQYGKGIFLTLEHFEPELIEKPEVPVRAMLYRLRNRLSSVYESVLEEKNASLADAMVLGDKKSLDADIKQLYQRNGIAHLIAISGLHIAMIGGTLYQFIRKCLGSYPVAAVIGIAFIVLYGIMTGLSGATCRAVIMLIISIGADVKGRRYDSITAITIALVLMLAENPYQISQVGFLLSFGAILGIALVCPAWKKLFPQIPSWLDGLLVSISVQLVILPVMLYYFYEIPVYGVLLNLIVVPLMSFLLAVLILCGITGCFLIEAAEVFSKPAQLVFLIYEKLCSLSEQLPFHTVCTGRPSAGWMICYYLFLVLFLLLVYYRGKEKILMIPVMGICSLFVTFWMPSALQICMFDVGQGDGIYIKTPNRMNILIDGGSSSKQKVGNYVLKNGVKYYGGAGLDYVFVSHSDSDHYSGISELLEEETIHIKNFVLPAVENPDEAYLELEAKAEQAGCQIYYMKKGDKLVLGDVTFFCMNPEEKIYEDKNQGSLVILMSYRNFDMLFTGDMDEMVEREIMPFVTDEIEVLKVAHHGSSTASSEAFLRKLSPDTACISVGANNRYGHPAEDVMTRLEKYCGNIYLTKENGAITIETDGYTYQIISFGVIVI